MYSVQQAAERLGLNPSHVRRLLKSGEISGTKIGHYWVVFSLTYIKKRKPKRQTT
jgi:excisionase family DNA binding protein